MKLADKLSAAARSKLAELVNEPERKVMHNASTASKVVENLPPASKGRDGKNYSAKKPVPQTKRRKATRAQGPPN